jgi:hypothetical protein
MTMSSANRCFICMKCPPILELVHQGQVNDVKLKSIWNKIFQYLLIPKEKFSETFDMCKGEWFCTDCVEIVHRVGNLQDKSVEFELKIQKNAEKLGEAIAAAGPTTGGMAGTSARSKKYQDAWEKFRLPILQSKFAKWTSKRNCVPKRMLCCVCRLRFWSTSESLCSTNDRPSIVQKSRKPQTPTRV